MRKHYLIVAFILLLFSIEKIFSQSKEIEVSIDLVHIENDKVKVEIKPALITSKKIIFQLPKIIPGTYSIADYGKYIDDFKAVDKAGKSLSVVKKDVNTWEISNAAQLDHVSYWVNDTYDSETGNAFNGEDKTIFSPAGTNILEGEQFMLNMAGFVGYFKNQKDFLYKVNIQHPEAITGTSSLDDVDASNSNDVFKASRYADLVDSPIMYAAPDIAKFTVDGMDVYVHVYSPRKKEINANMLLPDLQKMVVAQKAFLGKINKTSKYVVLVYVTSGAKDDARGIGALEHNNSTTSVFMESMTSEDLVHVISHEFFHTLTPLNVHSKEIQDFDFDKPKMSSHLWMYEGITEYFAHLFQVNQGLITEETFLNEMASKETIASTQYPQNVSFTKMSKNILKPKMQKIYPNVYEKGALFAMCIDIIIREKSNGQKGILDIMGQLSQIYGPNKPFDDKEIISVFTNLSYPEVGTFIQDYIVKGKPLDYLFYLDKVGVQRSVYKSPVQIALVVGVIPYVKIDKEKNQAIVLVADSNNVFIKAMGLENGDILLQINDQKIDAKDVTGLLMSLYELKEGALMSIKVNRNGKNIELNAPVKLNYEDKAGYLFKDQSKKIQKDNWLFSK